MADENETEVVLEIPVGEAIQRLAESNVRIERALQGTQALAETVAVSQDLIQGEQLANRALMKQLLDKYQRQDEKIAAQDARIAALVVLVDSHQATFENLMPPTGRPQ
jgi:hypothetical protein